jgi:hypothetical protein
MGLLLLYENWLYLKCFQLLRGVRVDYLCEYACYVGSMVACWHRAFGILK